MIKLEKIHWIGIIIGVLIAIVSLITLQGSKSLYFLFAIALLIITIPFMISFFLAQNKQKRKEEKFLEFTRDLAEMVRSGAPVSKSIVNLRNRNYGPLSPHIAKLSNQLSIGITLTNALETFASDLKSKLVSRAIGLISEAEKAGGNIETILDSVTKSVNQIEQLRKERKAAVSNLVTQGYLIFFVFIIIMLVLDFKILPLVSNLQGTEGLKIATNAIGPDQFAMPLFVMILVQSFFAGLVIGKISEGSIKSGFKHSFILLAITLLITTGAKALFA